MPYSSTHLSLREHLVVIMRMTTVAVITTVIILFGLTAVYGGQTREQNQIAETLVHTNLAQACILALPVDPVTGREPSLVKLCFTQYGLEPPSTLNP